MIDYIKGQIIELNPATLVLECGGIGYSIQISLQTFEILQNQEKAVVYIHHYLTEDNELFYGFATKDERELFRLLISVSGIGVNTARMIEPARPVVLITSGYHMNRAVKTAKSAGFRHVLRLPAPSAPLSFSAGVTAEAILEINALLSAWKIGGKQA